PAAAFRLRGGSLVLAFRRRGVAVPLPLPLRLGRLGRELRRLMISILPVPGRIKEMTEPTPQIAALKGLCPRCGNRTLFAGLATFAPACRACGLDFAGFNVGDGPAAFLIFIVGGIVVALAIALELSASPPWWLHVVLWLPLT